MLNKFLTAILCLIPIALVSGPFLSDLLLVLSCLIFVIQSYRYKLKNYYINKFFLFFIFYFVYLFLRSSFSVNPILSYESSLFYFRYGLFVLAVIYISTTKKEFLKYFFLSISFTLFFVSLDGLYQFIFDENLFGFIKEKYQITGLFRDEKILGSYTVRLTPIFFAFYFLFNKDNILNNFIAFFSLAFFFFITLISGERTSLFLMILLIFMNLIFLNGYNYFKFALIIFTIPLIIFSSTLTIKLIKDRGYIDTINQNNFVSKNFQRAIARNIYQTILSFGIYEDKIYLFSQQHQFHFETSFSMFKEKPIIGHGPKLYRYLCNEERFFDKSKIYWLKDSKGKTLTILTQCSTHPHNTYLQLLSEAGLIGTLPVFFIFLIVLSVLIKSLYNKLLKRRIITENFNISLLICIFINLWPLMPSANFFNNWIAILYFLPIGFYLKKYIN